MGARRVAAVEKRPFPSLPAQRWWKSPFVGVSSANTSHIDARESTFWTAGKWQPTADWISWSARPSMALPARRKTRESAAYTNQRRVDMASTEESVASLADLPARNVPTPRQVRGSRATARLVGLVRGVHERSSGRAYPQTRPPQPLSRYMAEVKNVVVSPA